MLWLIQEEGLFIDNRREDLINALKRLSIDFVNVDVTNNELIITEPFDENQRIITNGSVMLSKVAMQKKYEPGSLLNDNFDYEIWSEPYKEFLLNKNAVITSLQEAKVFTDEVFVRPVLDNKTFNGRVFTKEEFLAFQQKSLNGVKSIAKPDTKILLSPTKKIGQEHRHYIVDGEIVTSSRYKLAGLPNFSEGADNVVLDVVKDAIKTWQPARAFVLDTYIAGNEIGIVEIGCICHAGLYRADVMKLVNALDEMPMLNNKKSNKNKM